MAFVIVDYFSYMLVGLMWEEFAILKISRVGAKSFQIVANFSLNKQIRFRLNLFKIKKNISF